MSVATEVRERPILFSAPMVRAILDGSKTVTRRVVSRQNSDAGVPWEWLDLDAAWPDMLWGAISGLKVPTSKAPADHCPECVRRLYPRTEPGDLLWVRETWRVGSRDRNTIWFKDDGVLVLPDAAENLSGKFLGDRWRPSIHMPKWAARIWLRVTDVRVERVQEITEADAIAEGCVAKPGVTWQTFEEAERGEPMRPHTARDAFAALWDSLNASRGYGWDANPWVWRIEFERTEAPS